MSSRFDALPQRRAIIDRRDVADALANLPETGGVSGMRNAATPILRAALEAGRAEIARRLAETPARGTEAASSYAFLTDQIIRLIHDFTVERLYPLNNPSAAERLTLVEVGGYGSGEMALH